MAVAVAVSCRQNLLVYLVYSTVPNVSLTAVMRISGLLIILSRVNCDSIVVVVNN